MAIGKLFRAGMPFANVAANNIATASITPGRTLECIMLQLGGTTFTKALISLVKIKANGKVIYEATGAQIEKLAAFRGYAASALFLPIYFTELNGRDRVDQMVGAFDTSKGITNITMEVTIGAAVAPTLKMHLLESAPQTAGFSPVIAKVLRYPFNVSTGGQLPVQLPFGQSGAVLKRLHIEYAGAAGNVTGVVLKQDGLVVHESELLGNDFLNSVHGRTNQTNLYSLDFGIDDNTQNLLDTRDMRSLEFTPTFAAADAGFIIAEYLDVLGNL